MKANYKGHKIPPHVNIIPPEAMIGKNPHDLAVCCAIWTAGGLMTQEELEIVADCVREKHPKYTAQVAKTCWKIVDEELGYIYFVEETNEKSDWVVRWERKND